jgi:hypothetical protein
MPEKVSVNWLRSATPAWDQIGFVLQFQPRPPISGSFRNHAYVNVAAGPAPGRNWLRSAIPAVGPPYRVRFATTPVSMWRRARLRGGIGFVLQFQPRAPYWVRFATTPTSMRLRTRIGFVPPKAAGNAGTHFSRPPCPYANVTRYDWPALTGS